MAILPSDFASDPKSRTQEQKDDLDVTFPTFLTSKAKFPEIKDVVLYGLNSKRMLAFLQENANKKIGYIDMRLKAKLTDPAVFVQFTDANHFDVEGPTIPEIRDRIKTFKSDCPQRFWDLFLKDFVIIYCEIGQARSPQMMVEYALEYKKAQRKNINQKIILLVGGMDKYVLVDKKPYKTLEPWKDHGKDQELRSQPVFGGPGQTKPTSVKINPL